MAPSAICRTTSLKLLAGLLLDTENGRDKSHWSSAVSKDLIEKGGYQAPQTNAATEILAGFEKVDPATITGSFVKWHGQRDGHMPLEATEICAKHPGWTTYVHPQFPNFFALFQESSKNPGYVLYGEKEPA